MIWGLICDMATVTPWEVSGSIDYDKLVGEFGTKKITPALREKLVKLAGEENVMLRREFFFSHRDLDLVVKDYEAGKGFFIYAGSRPWGGLVQTL
jgi:tryptophanyl-tRNA synthetase